MQRVPRLFLVTMAPAFPDLSLQGISSPIGGSVVLKEITPFLYFLQGITCLHWMYNSQQVGLFKKCPSLLSQNAQMCAPR